MTGRDEDSQVRQPLYTPPIFFHSFRMTDAPSLMVLLLRFLNRRRTKGIRSSLLTPSIVQSTSSRERRFSQRARPRICGPDMSPISRSR